MIAARPLWLVAALLGLAEAAMLLRPLPQGQPGGAPVPASAQPAATAAVPLGRWSEAALARPVFSSTRRPDQAAQAQAAAPVRAGLPRLTGILVTRNGPVALFAAGDGARATVVAVGGALASWTVRAIRADLVTLDGPDGTVAMRPSYSNAPPRAQPVAAPANEPLLPPIPQTDNRPFEMMTQPSGASIFGHVTAPPAGPPVAAQPAPPPLILPPGPPPPGPPAR